jgi:hypothetical protein
MHDWSRADAGVYHDFHHRWVTHLTEALNAGLLPETHYALGETGNVSSTLNALNMSPEEGKIDNTRYLRKIVIRQLTEVTSEEVWFGDRIVALVEIVSGANKVSPERIVRFVENVLTALHRGIHVVVVDPFPATRRDSASIHGVLCKELGEPHFEPPSDRPLTLVSYCAGPPITAHVELMCVGAPLNEMPLFLTKTHSVPMPLEASYERAWTAEPRRWKNEIDPAASD